MPAASEHFPLIDSHCHLLHAATDADALAAVLRAAHEHGVRGMLSVATTPAELPRMAAHVGERANIWFAAGVHPEWIAEQAAEQTMLAPSARADTCVPDFLRDLPNALATIAATNNVVALGETGLDYGGAVNEHIRVWQRDALAIHLKAGMRHNLPVIIHTRGACADTIAVMRTNSGGCGVIHCFTEDYAAACAFIDLGFLISFSGILTFRNAADLRAVAARLPLDRLLIETDSPWLAPVPHRGKTNQPAWVRHTAEYLAELKGVSVATIAEATTRNFVELFDVNLSAAATEHAG